MRVTSAVIQRELQVSYYGMFLNDDDSVLVLRAQCKRRRAMRAHVLHFANYPNTTQCKRQTLCLSFADRMRMITSSLD
jgi:hypothetical protein